MTCVTITFNGSRYCFDIEQISNREMPRVVLPDKTMLQLKSMPTIITAAAFAEEPDYLVITHSVYQLPIETIVKECGGALAKLVV